MLIPIGHEDQQVARLPWITIVLVAVNVLIFLFTNQAVQQQATEMHERAQELIRYTNEHPYLHLPPEIRRTSPSAPAPADLAPEVIAEQQARLDAMLDEVKSGPKHGVFQSFGYVPARPSPVGLFTYMFLHGGWLHLLGNMLFLWLVGASLEDRWGRAFYPVVYVAGGAVAALAHAAMNSQSTVPMVGASGAIAGLMGAFLVRLAATRIRFFYWFLFVRGTFVMPAYVALPLWFLEQFAVAQSGLAGGIAVWAHIGGFLFGVLVAAIVKLTDLEKNILAPAIAKKTMWSAAEDLTAALDKLDRGDVEAGIHEIVAFLKRNPNNIEARAALVGAYTQKGDTASAERESARLVTAYVVARDLEGGMAALTEHRRAHPSVPVPLRSLLALAAYLEKQERHREAADLYKGALDAWPDDPLAPKAIIAYGRLMLETFQQADDTLALLTDALANPKMTPEFRRAAEELVAAARRAIPPRPATPEPAPAAPVFEPTSLTAETPEQPPQGSTTFAQEAVPSADMGAAEFSPTPEPAPDEMTPASTVDPSETMRALDASAFEPEPDVLPEPAPAWRLAPVSMRAVAMDTRGLRLQSPEGKIGQLPWQSVTGVSVARIEDPAAGASGPLLVLDLLMAAKSTPEGEVVGCVRLTGEDLALPQLQNEASPVRGFQRVVATILKVTGATAYPSRDDCLGLRGFPTFSDLEAYEGALVVCLRLGAA